MKGEIAQALLKAASVTTASAGAQWTFEKVALTLPTFWGVPVTVFGSAAVGVALSLFFGGTKVKSRRELWGQVLFSVLFGVAAAILCASAFNLHWAKENISAFAFVCAAVTRWFLPGLIERVRKIIREYKLSISLDKKEGDQ